MKTKLLVFKTGERFPILLGDDGMPLFYPTVYEVTMRRQTNRASATLSADLAAIKFLYLWADKSCIDLEDRFHKAEFLSVKEIDSLADAMKNRIDAYVDDIPLSWPSPEKSKPVKAQSILKFRMPDASRQSGTRTRVMGGSFTASMLSE